MTRKQKLQVVAAVVAVSAGAVQSFAAAPVVVYSDDFNRAALNGGTYVYTQSSGSHAAGADDFAGISNNALLLTNNNSAAANTAAPLFVSTPTSAFPGFNPIMSANGRELSWTLNLQNNVANPSGFAVGSSGNTGQAFVLGSTSSDFYDAGAQGYAVIIGETGGNPDPIRLYRFDNGLNAIGTGAPSNTAGKSLAAGPGAGTDSYSVRVIYNTVTGAWSLETRDDGGAFADPSVDSNYVLAAPPVVDNTYTGIALGSSGAYIAHNTANFNALYDNVSLTIKDTPGTGTPRNLVWDGNAATPPNPSDTSGNWGDAGNWFDGSTNVTWNNDSPDNATFGTGSGTGSVTVSLPLSQTAGQITFAANSPTYTITGSNFNVAGFFDGTATQGMYVEQSTTINSNMAWVANARMHIDGSSILTMNGALLGFGQITKYGTGTLLLNTPSPGFTGGIDIETGTVHVVSVNAAGISGFGTGTVTVNSGGTLWLDATSAPQTYTASGQFIMGNGGTLHVTGNVTWAKNDPRFYSGGGGSSAINSTIHVDAGGTLLFKSQLKNEDTEITSTHVIHVDGPGTIKITNSGTDGGGNADIYGGDWDLSAGTLILGQNSETNGSTGDTLNALGFKGGDSSVGNTVTVRGSAVLVGTENIPNPTSNIVNAYKANVIMSGGTLASGNGKDTNWGGPFTTTAATTSTIAVYDPTNPTVARNLSLTFGPASALIQQGDTDWNGNVVVDPGTTTGGSFILNRDSGSIISVTPGVSITVNAGAGLQDIGPTDNLSDGTNSVNVVNNSNVTSFVVDGGITKNVGTLDGTGSTTIAASTSLNTNHIIQSSVTLHGSAAVREDANPFGSNAGTSKITTLAMDPTSKLDLTNNKLILGNAIGSYNGSQYTGVLGQVQSGRNGGTWDGPGILTSESSAKASGGFLTTLAVAEAADVKHISGATTATFGGQTVHATDTLVMYTFAGDANLSGHIDADDYFQIDSHYNKNGTNSAISYINGDFNYDGVINGDDYFLIDSNYAAQGGNSFSTSEPLSLARGVSAVPEPASLAMLGLATAGLFGRRRRQR